MKFNPIVFWTQLSLGLIAAGVVNAIASAIFDPRLFKVSYIFLAIAGFALSIAMVYHHEYNKKKPI